MRKRFLVLLCLLMLIPASIQAKSGESHLKDMGMVLGIYTDNKRDSGENLDVVYPYLRLINMMIDDVSIEHNVSMRKADATKNMDSAEFIPSLYYTLGSNNAEYHKLMERYNFSWSSYGHRLMFHWGFDYGKPLNTSALSTALRNKNVDMNEVLSEQLIDDIKQLQKIRMEKMRQATDDYFYLSGATRITRGVAGILYYVHLIGDHIECANDMTAEAVLPLDSIQKNLIPLIDDLRISEGDKSLRARTARTDIEHLKLSLEMLRKSDNVGTVYAQQLLDLLIKYIPSTMKFWLNSASRKRGFSFVR